MMQRQTTRRERHAADPCVPRLGMLRLHLGARPCPSQQAAGNSGSGRPRIALICSQWWPQSHSDVVGWKLIKGTTTDEGYRPPQCDVVSIYIDQIEGKFDKTEEEAIAMSDSKVYKAFTAASCGDQDNGCAIAADAGIPVYSSIRKALLAGGDTLGIDGVVLIGEHGDYPTDELGRTMYPRAHFFEQISGVFAASGRSVPIFNDKHYSYNIEDAVWMWERARALSIPLMGGSSLVVCWRRPFLEHPRNCNMQEALIVANGGPDGYHTLEALQCMVERRAGGESGVCAVTVLKGDAMWAVRDEGKWSDELAHRALAAITDEPIGELSEELADADPCVFLIEHSDGFVSVVLGMGSYTVPRSQDDGQIYGDWGYAAVS